MTLYNKRFICLLIVSILLAYSVYASPSSLIDLPNPLIVGGDSAALGDYPEFAILRIYQPEVEGIRRCSATLIAPNKVLTAGHCIREVAEGSRFTVIPMYYNQSLDGQNELEVAVIDANVHPDYAIGLFSVEADVAVLTLERSVDSKVASVLISDEPIDGKSATVLGIGLTNYDPQRLPTELQKFNTVIPSNESCNKDELSGVFYEPHHICISPRFAPSVPCFGDSGGPILIKFGGRHAVAGVGSSLDEFNCEIGTTFAVYTRVTRYTDFIKRHSPNTRFIRADMPAPVTSPILNLLLNEN